MSGPSRREEQDRRSRQPVTRFSLKGLFNKLTGLLGIRALFNFFARPRGPRPVPIKIDPAWFPVPRPAVPTDEADWTPPRPDTPNVLPPWEPPWVQTSAYEPPLETEYPDDFDPVAFAEEYPDWDEEPPEPEEDTIRVKPGERVPLEAGELLRTYYAPGIGDVRVFARLDPNEMDIDPGQVLGPDDIGPDEPVPEKKPKSPK